jgi:hypothetical protein
MDENSISLTSSPDSLLPSNINKNNLEVEMTSKISTSEETKSNESSNNNFNYSRADIENKEEEKDLIFGNPINKEKPIHLGNTFTFIYFRNSPLIVIGPDCKILFIISLRFIFYFFSIFDKFILYSYLFQFI